MRKMPRESSRGEHTRTDPDYSPTAEVFDNMSHQEIHAKVQLLDPAALTAGQQAWQGSATGLGDAVAQAHTDIRGAIANGWRGAAAARAAAAIQAFEQHGQDLADVLAAVAVRLGQAGDAAEALRAAVPAASGAEPNLSAALLDPGQASANVDTQKAVENARLDVVQAMETIYAGAFLTTGSGIPAFPDQSTETTTVTTDSTAPVGAVPALGPNTAGALPGGFLSTIAATTDVPVEAGTVEQEQPIAEEPTEEAAPAPDTTVAPAAAEAPAPAQTVAAATTPAATTLPAAAVPVASTPGAPIAAVAPAATAPASVSTPAPLSTGTATAAEDNRRREERRQDNASDAATGLGAGAMGGLMGGALAAGDTTRAGSGLSAPAARPSHDDFEDDELHFSDDELTFLEPADEAGELIGSMDPTTPPVLGEWTERE